MDAARPVIRITYCTQCQWLLRAGWMAQELLSTFGPELGEDVREQLGPSPDECCVDACRLGMRTPRVQVECQVNSRACGSRVRK